MSETLRDIDKYYHVSLRKEGDVIVIEIRNEPDRGNKEYRQIKLDAKTSVQFIDELIKLTDYKHDPA